MKLCVIYLVRHGQSVANSKDIVAGQIDVPLTELGKEQAAEAGKKLKSVKFDAAYSSDLQRAAHTAAIIVGKDVPSHRQIEDFRERSFGKLDGKSNNELRAVREEQAAHLKTLNDHARWRHSHVEGMESNHELSSRFVSAMEQVAKDHRGQTILIAAHGAAMRTTLIAIGYGSEDELPSGSISNAGYAQIEYDDNGFRVVHVVGVSKFERSNE